MISRTVFSAISSVVAAFALFALIGAGPASAADGADKFIDAVGKQAIDSLTGRDLSDTKRQTRFRALLNEKFEVPLIARFTLGRYWRKASKNQRQEYVGLFEDYIVLAYVSLFQNYSGETFTVGEVRPVNKTDSLVRSELALKDGRKIVVFWRVRDKGELKIIDVIVEGVSMVITQREQFAAIINQNGGSLDGLLKALREKTRK